MNDYWTEKEKRLREKVRLAFSNNDEFDITESNHYLEQFLKDKEAYEQEILKENSEHNKELFKQQDKFEQKLKDLKDEILAILDNEILVGKHGIVEVTYVFSKSSFNEFRKEIEKAFEK